MGSAIGGAIGSLFGSSGGTSPASGALSGLIAGTARPSSQTNPGSYSPNKGSGEAYNYIPTGQANVDQMIQQLLQSSQSTTSGALPGVNADLSTLLNSQLQNPTVQGLMSSGSAAGAMSGSLAAPTLAGSTALNNSVLSALPQFNQILAQGTDPQSALYNRTLQQVQDQTRVSNAARGLDMSPQGAGVENQALSNFNIDWQNQQLARSLSAMQGYSGAVGQAGTSLGQAGQLGQAATGFTQQAGQLPYNSYNTAQGGFQTALQNYLSGLQGSQNLGNQNLNQMLGYLGTGQNANQIANNVASGQATNIAAQNAGSAAAVQPLVNAGLTGAGSILNNIFGSSGSSGSSGILSSIFGMAEGGEVPGDPRVGDNMPIKTTPGEFVHNRATAQAAPRLMRLLNTHPEIAKLLDSILYQDRPSRPNMAADGSNRLPSWLMRAMDDPSAPLEGGVNNFTGRFGHM